MSNTTTVWFPTPIGGNITEQDKAPSIVYIALYALLIPPTIYNFFWRHQWNTTVIGTLIFTIERVVLYSLRLRQASGMASPESSGLLIYQQLTFGLGYIGLGGDILQLFRSLVSNALYPPGTWDHLAEKQRQNDLERDKLLAEEAEAIQSGKSVSIADRMKEIGKGDDEHAIKNTFLEDENVTTRRKFRRFMDLFGFTFLAAIIPGAVGGGRYGSALNDQSAADAVANARLVSSILTLVFSALWIGAILYTLMRIPRISRSASYWLIGYFVVMIAITGYRLPNYHHRETSLLSRGPESMTDTSDKVLFYIFHGAVEWVTMATLLLRKTRDAYGTFRFGDSPNDRTYAVRVVQELRSNARRARKESGQVGDRV